MIFPEETHSFDLQGFLCCRSCRLSRPCSFNLTFLNHSNGKHVKMLAILCCLNVNSHTALELIHIDRHVLFIEEQ